MSDPKDLAKMVDQHNTVKVLNEQLEKQPAALVIPEGFDVENVDRLRAHQARPTSSFVTPSIKAFIEYTNDRAATADSPAVFITERSGDISARCIFNRGTFNEPSHGDDYALLALNSTEEHSTLNRLVNQTLTQRNFVEFLEEYEPNITFYDADGAVMLNSTAVAAFRRVTVERHTENASHVEDMAETHSSMEQVEARSEFILPSHFKFACIPYHGLSEVTYTCRLRPIFTSDKPQFKYRIFQGAEVREKINANARALLTEGLDPVFVDIFEGEYNA